MTKQFNSLPVKMVLSLLMAAAMMLAAASALA